MTENIVNESMIQEENKQEVLDVQVPTVKANFTADIGSTESRVVVYSKTDFKSRLTKLSSDYGIVVSDISYIPSKSDALDDNLEICIQDITPMKTNPMFDTIRIVKGSLLNSAKLPLEKLNSTTGKRDKQQYYVNLIASIGYNIVSRAQGSNLCERYVADLTLAIIPDDTRTTKRVMTIKENVQGTYRFMLPRLGIEFNIEIPENGIFIEDESQANLRFYAVDKKEDCNGIIVLMDIGGGSTDVALIENGELIKSFSKTIPMGGTKLKSILSELVLDSYDFDISDEMAERAIKTGYLQDGSSVVDVKDLVSKARQKFGRMLMNGLISIFTDNNNFNPRMVNKLLLVGRPCKTLAGTHSLQQIMKVFYGKLSPNTEVDTIKKENPIVYGLMYYRVSQED